MCCASWPTCVISCHLVVQGLLIAVILFQLSRKSYKPPPPKKPLIEKVNHYCAKMTCFWTLLQEMYSSKLHLCRRLIACVMKGSQSLYALPSRRGAELTLPCWKGMCHTLLPFVFEGTKSDVNLSLEAKCDTCLSKMDPPIMSHIDRIFYNT
jgi:hypothetical protein